ncbi:MAG: YbhB/YbcL family Raf kinase inhibitor-like protein [Myxococcales bacterium]|nr:YbhB/YbcL family Raf kinase inhibitor-like protein [Myxococcales bacterium]
MRRSVVLLPSLGLVIGLGGLGGLVGCGDDGGGGSTPDANDVGDGGVDSSIDSAIDAPSTGTFTLTSPTIMEAGTIPRLNACGQQGGSNLSPQLVFTNPPAGTLSYAVVLTDLTNNLVHCAIYDVPGGLTGLIADVDKFYLPPDVPGAHQTNAYTGMRGYAGPCPPAVHNYQFKVYALGVDKLPGTTMATTKEQIVTAVATNLGTATLTANYTP